MIREIDLEDEMWIGIKNVAAKIGPGVGIMTCKRKGM